MVRFLVFRTLKSAPGFSRVSGVIPSECFARSKSCGFRNNNV